MCVLLSMSSVLLANAAPSKIQSGDAYAKSNESGTVWSIGTSSVQLDFAVGDGNFRISSFKNLLATPHIDYMKGSDPICPLAPDLDALKQNYVTKELWAKALSGGASVDMASTGLKLKVKKGEMIGFAVGPHGDFQSDQTDWPTKVTYNDGESYSSSTDKDINQGPVWFYCINVPGTGFISQMDEITWSSNTQQKIRVPKPESGYRAGQYEPHVGPSVLHPSNLCDALRVWKAPKDGTVTISGVAHQIGGGNVDLRVLIIREKTAAELKAVKETRSWKLESARAEKILTNGRPAVQLNFLLKQDNVRMKYHVVAYPGTSVFRQWSELENLGKSPAKLGSYNTLLSLNLNTGNDKFTNYWMIGGNHLANQAELHAEEVPVGYNHSFGTTATGDYVPWVGVKRNSGAQDGLFVAPDYLGLWQITVNRPNSGHAKVTVGCGDLLAQKLAPGKSRRMPYVTFGIMNGGLDNMAENLYNWQYEYMWDYTHDDWYTKMLFTVAWYGDSDNAQQQFAGHLGDLDMNWTDYIRTSGMEVLWEDAGWSATHHWWEADYEGPDFAQTRRFLDKNDMKLAVWIAGHQSSGLLESKVAAWGNFQRRTDGMGFDSTIDKTFRTDTEKFLNDNPRCSFHTCSGGSTYAHTFEVQRYTDINYDADGPSSDYTNAYWSYLETPDKWFDNLNSNNNMDTRMRFLTQTPKWGLYITPTDLASMRRLCDIYHYMLKVGVAGRWSYIVHPKISGDDDRHYCQRLNYDHTKSMIILKHRATNDVTIYPKGLIPQKKYLVEYEVIKDSISRTGADLMKNGIVIKNQKPGELIYFNMPNRPGSGRDKTAPQPPTNVLAKRETNIGYAGVGIYWSPGSDNNWISYYEVKRGDEVLAKISTGTYYFDRSAGWNPAAQYAVRTVDGDGNTSPWTPCKRLADEQLTACALGGLFSESGREGWVAETTSDGKNYQPMKWVPPARPTSADLGGTTIQPGGAEGYWENGTARVGRGWQQAAADADCSRTWVAGTSGKIRITGRSMKEYYHRDSGEPLNVRIMLNDKQVWPESGWAVAKVGDSTGAQHDFELNVASGDQVRFILGRGTSPDNDLIAWMPSISYVDSGSNKSPESVVRIFCGSAKNYTDKFGVVWSADKFFKGGNAIAPGTTLQKSIQLVNDANLYKYGRTGKDFTYSIPVKPGTYCIRMKFAEPKYAYLFERPFNVSINGKQVMTNFDICQAARGPKRAFDRLVRYVVPNGDGKINIRFTGGWEPSQKTNEALIQAIEITPESRPTVRINAGSGTEFVDWNSFVWSADTGFDGGNTITGDAWVAHATPTLYDQSLYQTARTGKKLSYKVSLPDGLYSVHLKFAELWLKELGKRPMDIAINGRLVRKAWDPATQAGKVAMSADIRVDDIVPDKNGQISITLKAVGANDAILQGIEIE